MTGLEIPLLIAATATAGVSAYMQHRSSQQQAKAEAAWHDYNSKVAEREAAAEQRAAAFEAKQHKRRSKMLLAEQRSLIGASGVQMVGSPLLVAVDTAKQLALEGANIRERGQRRVSALKSQSILDTSKGKAARSKASGYGTAALMSAGSSILQGASSVAGLRKSGSGWWPKNNKMPTGKATSYAGTTVYK